MKWRRIVRTCSMPHPLVEYVKTGEDCAIRQNYITYDEGHSYKENGWDVVCHDNDGEVKIEKIAWFRHLKEAQFFVDLRRNK